MKVTGNIGKLIEFVVFSRIPKRTLAFYLLIAFFLGYLGYSTYAFSKASIREEFAYLSIFYLTSMVAVSPVNTRFGLVNKSDSDFLALLPFDDDKIITSLIIGSFLVSVIFLSIFTYWFIVALGILGIVVIPEYALISSTLPAVLYNLNNKKKILIDLVIVLWMVSALFHFPLSPLSMFYGYFEGYVLSFVLAFGVFFLALKKFNFSAYSNVVLSSEKGEVKEEISFKSSSPLVLTLVRNLRIIEIGGRVNWMGMSTFVSRRVSLWKVLLASSVVAVILYIALKVVSYAIGVISLSFYILFGGWLLMTLIASASFITEPLWLDLNVMTPVEFARYYLISKAVSVAVILSPFAVLFLISGYIGDAIGLLVFIPLSSIFMMSLYARYYQQRYNAPLNVSPMRFLIGLLSSIPLFPLLVLAFIDSLFPGFCILLIPALAVFYLLISMPFLVSSSYWESTVEKIVTSVT
ncbi:hypothetical protein [Acidianus sp. HS-5]|uniref:hypothetical protein n=1 Tax=Acidianus sp. HS-5 TaxID=2886040 RepID=UPI001F3C5152|nr:hypothetical protein [Acidianus sp. HS-5]